MTLRPVVFSLSCLLDETLFPLSAVKFGLLFFPVTYIKNDIVLISCAFYVCSQQS